MTESDLKPAQEEPWFSGKPGTVLLYRINRRPMPEQSLFDVEPPPNVLDHVAEVLLFGEEVETGRKNKRHWILGNRNIDEQNGTLAGQIGWESRGIESTGRYDSSRREWVDDLDQRARAARAPFVFESDGRTLAILKHPSFSESTLSEVFKALLQRGENRRGFHTTDWDVEPIGDTGSFREWLSNADVVNQVQFVAKRPNPDGLDEFGQVWERMNQHKASLLREIMEAADPEVGLVDLEGDQVVNGYLAMSEHAFGYVTARGTRDGRLTRFDQRSAVARRQTEPLPSSWTEAVGVITALARQVWRQRHDS